MVLNIVWDSKIPPPPPRPDFDSSREKLQKLGEGEGSMTAEEFKKMKQELEAYGCFFFTTQEKNLINTVSHTGNTWQHLRKLLPCMKSSSAA